MATTTMVGGTYPVGEGRYCRCGVHHDRRLHHVHITRIETIIKHAIAPGVLILRKEGAVFNEDGRFGGTPLPRHVRGVGRLTRSV